MYMASYETFVCEVRDDAGLHARPAANLARFAGELESTIRLSGNGKTVDAKSMIMVMSLGIKSGETVSFEVLGDNAEDDRALLENYCSQNL